MKAFGEWENSVNSISNGFAFAGQYKDAETSTYYNLNRDYDSNLGRYIESDPIGLDGGINLYQYANQSPINRIDPTGESSVAIPVPGVPGWVKPWFCFTSIVGAASCGGTIIAYCVISGNCFSPPDDCEREKRKKRCQNLKDEILKTCAGLTGKKMFRCFYAADDTYDQCMED